MLLVIEHDNGKAGRQPYPVPSPERCRGQQNKKPKRSEMAVRAGCRRCAEDGRQKGK